MKGLCVTVVLGLAMWGCEASAPPVGDIQPEPVAVEHPPARVDIAPPVGEIVPAANVEKPPAAEGAGSCCGSPSCQRAAAAAGAPAGQGCGCRRGLPPEVAAQVNCGG